MCLYLPLFQALQDELENRASQVRCAEKKLQHKELESQEQVGALPAAAWLVGLLPVSRPSSLYSSGCPWDALAARNRIPHGILVGIIGLGTDDLT